METNPGRYVKFSAKITRLLLLLAVGALLLSGCAAARSPIVGKYTLPVTRNSGAPPVSVFFHFRHLSQQYGFDSIPKLHAYGVKDFDNLFRDALPEISNVATFNTFQESPQDVNNLKRRTELDKHRSSHDYTVEFDFLEESSFKQQCFSGTISLLSLSVIPMPYSWDYTITATIYDKKRSKIGSYQRKATLDNWVEALLIFAYPFYPLEGKREEIYSESMHDIFRQIEAEKVFRQTAPAPAPS